jgi:hypothetical protein
VFSLVCEPHSPGKTDALSLRCGVVKIENLLVTENKKGVGKNPTPFLKKKRRKVIFSILR